jgi:membrane-associated protease RseP (regulator of RpoE activity)
MNRLLKVSMALSLLLSIPLMADESFGGVGITIVPAKEGVRVVEVIPGTPAAEAGVLPEDRICAVDAVSITGKSFDEARDALRGQKGKPVEISVIREGDTLSLTMRRKTLTIKDYSEQSIEKWYGKDKSSYSKEELEAVALQGASSDAELLSVMSDGYVVLDNETVSACEVKAVYVDKEPVFKEKKNSEKKAPVKGNAKLKAFNRSVVGFVAKPKAGDVRLVITDANGQVYLDKVVSAKPGANQVSWDGDKVPSGRYSITLEQAGTVSTYFSVLR